MKMDGNTCKAPVSITLMAEFFKAMNNPNGSDCGAERIAKGGHGDRALVVPPPLAWISFASSAWKTPESDFDHSIHLGVHFQWGVSQPMGNWSIVSSSSLGEVSLF